MPTVGCAPLLRAGGVAIVVEPDRDIAELVAVAVSRCGYVPLLVPTVSQLAQAVPLRPSLIVLDQTLPGLSGVRSALREVRSVEGLGCPVVLTSAWTEEGHAEVATAAGAVAYAEKPFTPSSLTALLAGLAARASERADGGMAALAYS